MRTAVVLFNLGGPDRPEAVRPFLFNLFNDPAIISLPRPVRWGVAKLVSARRAPVAREIYARLGGGSPLLENSETQARKLEQALRDMGDVRACIAMRYWHPRSDETAAAVKAFEPDRIVLLPLYPQFSTTTTASSFADWHRAAAAAGLSRPTRAVCCYPDEPGFIDSLARRLHAAIAEAAAHGAPRVLFSAHGLPKKIVAGGDPYQWQVERSAAAVVAALPQEPSDWTVCYQSRVGPLEWIGPSTDAEIERAGNDGVPVVVVPLAFVSEHSETLVELDIEYAALAERSKVPVYVRVPTVSDDDGFIAGLANVVRGAWARDGEIASYKGDRLCPEHCVRCGAAG